MKNTNHKIDPSIAFCAKSSSTLPPNKFNSFKIIYRKLINPVSELLTAGTYIAVDMAQIPVRGDLTLFDFNSDVERIDFFDEEESAQGKVIAYSKGTASNDFFTSYPPAEPAPENTINTEHTITLDDLNQWGSTLKTLLDSGLFSANIWGNINKLHRSLDTFESLLSIHDESQSNKGPMQ